MRERAHVGGLVFAAAILATSVEAAAQVEVLQHFAVGNWEVAAYARGGRFSYCAGGTFYGSGIRMLFSIDRPYRWGMGFQHRNWRMTTGEEFDTALSVDGKQAIHMRAKVVEPTRLAMDLKDRVLLDQLQYGLGLRASVENRVYSFDLDGISAMLSQLQQCARRYTQPASVANSQEGKRRTVNTRETVRNPALQAEAAVLLANVMSAAKVSGYAMGTPEQAAKMSVHAVWTAPSVVGTLLIIPGRRVNDPEIPGLVTGLNAMECKGAFMSGSLPSDGTRAVRVTTTCQPPGQPLSTSYYFGIPRPKGGIYLFTTTTTQDGGREDAERADEMIRQATYRASNR